MWWKKWRTKLSPAGAEAEDGSDKKKVNPLIVWSILIAIALLAGSSLFGSHRTAENAEPDAELAGETTQEIRQYIAQEEERLAEVLSRVRGAGRVTVMVSAEDGGEKVLAADRKSRSEHRTEGEEAAAMSTEQEENTVLTGQSAAQQPFVVKEKRPNLTGVVVIADGAASESVRLELYEAVKALYGIAPHRIKVTAAQTEKE